MFTFFAFSHQFKTKFFPFHTPFETKFLPFHTPFETKFLPFHTPFETKFLLLHTPFETIFCLFTFLWRQFFCLFTPPKTLHGNLKNAPPQQQQQEEEQRFPLPDLSAAPQIKTVNPNSNIRSNIRISRTDFLGSNIRFSEYEYSLVENTEEEAEYASGSIE